MGGIVARREDARHPAVQVFHQHLIEWNARERLRQGLLTDELSKAFSEVDETTGRPGFTVILLEHRSRGRWLLPDNKKHRNIMVAPGWPMRYVRELFTSHLLRMSPAESYAFLEHRDNDGVTVREHASRHGFFWAPPNVSEGQCRIKTWMSNGVVEQLLLMDVKDIWCAPGKRRRFPAMMALAECATLGNGTFFRRLIAAAAAQDAEEDLRYAFVSGLISLLQERSIVGPKLGADIVSYMELLGIDSRHFDATATLDERGIAHCPLGPDLQAFVYPRLLPRHLQLRTKGRMLPVEVLLTRGTVPRRLLELGASLDFGPLPHHRPAVHGARRSAELMLLMLEFEADATALDAEGRTALYEFSRLSGRAVEALVAAGLDPNERGRWPDRPLVTGLQRGAVDELKRLEALQAMIDAGSDLSATLANGCTAMMLVNPAEMDMLHQAGADPEAVSEHGGTALIQFLIYSDQVPPEYLLTERNLTTVCRAHKEWLICSTALGWAVSFNRSSAVIEALLEAGADPNGARESGNCPVTLPEWYRPPVLCSRGNTVSEAARVLAHLGASIPTGLDTGYKFTLAKCRAYNELRTQVLGTRTKRA